MEVASLRQVGRAICRSQVRIACPRDVASHLLQVRAHRMQAVVLSQSGISLELADQVESSLWPLRHADRDGMIQRDHRIGRRAQQHLVEADNLVPVRCFHVWRLVMDGGDGGLDLVRVRAVPAEGPR